MKVLEVKVDELSEALKEVRSEKVHTMDASHYMHNHKVRECCMKLMSHNVFEMSMVTLELHVLAG